MPCDDGESQRVELRPRSGGGERGHTPTIPHDGKRHVLTGTYLQQSCLVPSGPTFYPPPVGSANDVAVTSPDVTRCHGMSQGDRERSR